MFEKAKHIYDESGRGFGITLLVIYDILAVLVSAYGALFIRFEFSIESISEYYLERANDYLPFQMITTVVIFIFLRLYQSLWRYASVRELFTLVIGCISSSALQIVGTLLLGIRMPKSYYILYLFIFLCFSVAGRFSYRFFLLIRQNAYLNNKSDAVETMLIGAGEAGVMLLRELRSSYHLNFRVVCAIDDDPKKKASRIHGIPILGGRDKIADAVQQYGIQEIIIAIPSLSAKSRKELALICKDTGCKTWMLPGIYQMVRCEVHISDLREIQIEDLLGREPIRTNMDEIMGYVENQVVLVTGAGGSIGSELCRQIAAHRPKQLILFDIYENTTYELQMELKHDYPWLNAAVLIGSVCNFAQLAHIFQTYHPALVYHAAAHKHVPLMEDSPNEAVKNNVVGTWRLVLAADQWQVKRLVMISTDKAVNPTNVMGATKRICEMIIQTYNRRSKTEFVAVRFGNVLGSHGSVVPLFQKQIEAGGPVTVTHPDIIRYFMTISEAVALVLQAGAYAKGGEIFVLEMGEPVKIDTLARNLIILSGRQPDVEIPIVYTGLRPGEKLYEEILMKEEGLRSTKNNLIHIAKPIELEEETFLKQLAHLQELTEQEPENIRDMIKNIVTTYQPG